VQVPPGLPRRGDGDKLSPSWGTGGSLSPELVRSAHERYITEGQSEEEDSGEWEEGDGYIRKGGK